MHCIVGRIKLSPHPDPQLRVGEINGHVVVVGDHYDDGTLGFFIPDGAIIPDKLAEEMWVKGKLAGKQRNRVKARDFKGVFSEGLFYGSRYFLLTTTLWVPGGRTYHDSPSWNPAWKEGDDVTEEVGVTFNAANN
jgi:hypothetical protein